MGLDICEVEVDRNSGSGLRRDSDNTTWVFFNLVEKVCDTMLLNKDGLSGGHASTTG